MVFLEEIAMTLWKMFGLALASTLVSGFLALGMACADDEDKKDKDKAKPAPAGTLIVIDNAGKEHTLKEWKFVKGTGRLSWLTEPEKKDKDAKEQKDKDKEAKEEKNKEKKDETVK